MGREDPIVNAHSGQNGFAGPQETAYDSYAAYLLEKCVLLESILSRTVAVNRCLLSFEEEDSLKKALGLLHERREYMLRVDKLDQNRPEKETMTGSDTEEAQLALQRQLLERIREQETTNYAKIDEIMGRVGQGLKEINTSRKEVFTYLRTQLGMEGRRLDTMR